MEWEAKGWSRRSKDGVGGQRMSKRLKDGVGGQRME